MHVSIDLQLNVGKYCSKPLKIILWSTIDTLSL